MAFSEPRCSAADDVSNPIDYNDLIDEDGLHRRTCHVRSIGPIRGKIEDGDLITRIEFLMATCGYFRFRGRRAR